MKKVVLVVEGRVQVVVADACTLKAVCISWT